MSSAMSAGGQASAVSRATSALTFFPSHLAVITLLGGRSVRLLPLSHFKLWFLSALVRHMVLFWRPAFVRNSTFAVFSVRHFRSAVFSVRSRSDFSGRMTLRMQRIPYPRTFLAVRPCVCDVYHTRVQSSRLQLQLVLHTKLGHQRLI